MTDYAISRDSRRVPLETRVQLRFERFSGFISEYSSNVSPGGMFVKSQGPSPVGTLLDFEFQLGDGYPLMTGTGEVVWLRNEDQGPDHPAGMGIRFLRLSKGSRELIYKMVDEYVHQGGVPFDIDRAPEPAAAVSPAAGDAATPPGDYGAPEPEHGGARGRRAAALGAALLLLGAGVAAFLFQDSLMRRFGFLGAGEVATGGQAPAAEPAESAPAAPAAAPALPAPVPASDDAIPEPSPGIEPAREPAIVPAAARSQTTIPAPPPAAPASVPRLTVIRSIDWREVDGETEVTIRGDAPIVRGGYARDRLDGAAPRELFRIRGVERPFGRAQLAVGTPLLRQIRTGHHVRAGGDELHLVLDLADSAVVVRAVREVDGALVVRIGRS
ncbi:MAG TPA: TIGR02266 family protein [Thermoanaerobaculia bacterium]|nr:TIGR02266 family protein [Thermoanaerobaculia bacterium]